MRIINEFEAETLDELIAGLETLKADAVDWSIDLRRPVSVRLWEERDEDGDAVLNTIAIEYL